MTDSNTNHREEIEYLLTKYGDTLTTICSKDDIAYMRRGLYMGISAAVFVVIIDVLGNWRKSRKAEKQN